MQIQPQITHQITSHYITLFKKKKTVMGIILLLTMHILSFILNQCEGHGDTVYFTTLTRPFSQSFVGKGVCPVHADTQPAIPREKFRMT